MKKLLLAAAAAAFLVPGPARAAESGKIAYVDLQKVFLTSDVGRQSKKALDKEADAKRKVLEEKKKEFQKMQEEIEKKMAILSDDAKREKIQGLEKKREELLEFVKESDQTLAEKDRELTRSISGDLQGILKAMAEKGGYTMILEKGGILWGPDDLDITDEVIAAYNKKSKK